MPRLYVLSGPDVGKHFEVSDGATLGRSAECSVHLRDASVSRLHARIEHGPGGLAIVDSQSRNGLRAGGHKVERLSLTDGAEFEVGEVLLRFRAEAAHAPAAGAPSIAPPASSHPMPPARPPVEEPPARAPAARPADEFGADLGAEIELEGDWNAAAPTSFSPARSAPPASAQSVPPPSASMSRHAPSPAPARVEPAPEGRAPERVVERRSPPPLRPAAGAAPRSSDPTSSRAVLQYHKVEQKEGLLGSDLAQQPIWVKALAVLVGLALFAGIFWLAFRGTSILRGRGEDPRPADTTDER